MVQICWRVLLSLYHKFLKPLVWLKFNLKCILFYSSNCTKICFLNLDWSTITGGAYSAFSAPEFRVQKEGGYSNRKEGERGCTPPFCVHTTHIRKYWISDCDGVKCLHLSSYWLDLPGASKQSNRYRCSALSMTNGRYADCVRSLMINETTQLMAKTTTPRQ